MLVFFFYDYGRACTGSTRAGVSSFMGVGGSMAVAPEALHIRAVYIINLTVGH